MYKLEYAQKIPLTLHECWDFFSSPANLKTLTPDYLDFKITSMIGGKMYPGQIIAYTIRPVLNLPFDWVTEIAQVQEPHYFIDRQLLGPYKFWHHEHRFTAIYKGVEIIDSVHYQMPFGPLGKIIHSLKVKRDLQEIFQYRRVKLEKMFGPYRAEI